MARTPLFRLLRRSVQQARAAHLLERPTHEVVEALSAAARTAPTRREFLRQGAAAGALLGLAGCAPGRGGGGGGDPVVIVGAGIAGLTAAHRLRQQGVPVRLFEAQNRIGGRMYSLRGHFPGGQVAELGGELVDTDHHAIRRLAAELEIHLDDLHDEDPSLEEVLWHFGGVRRSDPQVVEAFRPLAARITADLEGIDPEFSYRDPSTVEALDRLSIAQWLDGAGASGWVRDLLDVAYTTECGLEIDQQSALNLLLLIDPEPDPFRVFGDSDERFRVHDGNDAIPLALGRLLDDAIETGSVLESVRPRAGGGFLCTFRRDGGALEVSADELLLTLPFTLLREVELAVELPEVKRRAIRELTYGTNAKLMLGFQRRIWREDQGSAGTVVTDLPFQLCWETSRWQEGREGILTNFTGGANGMRLGEDTPEEAARRVAGEMEGVFPGIAATREGMTEARMHWPSHPWTRGSYACYTPGQWAAFHGVEGERVGPLHFAGEHTSLEAQGFMEGGCESGERAAAKILADRGMPAGVEARGVPAPAAVGRRAALVALAREAGLMPG